MFEKKKIGLALGGGGGRGFAHIGVLKVLERLKIPIDMISGTSMGAVIGALYCAEPNAKKIEKEALSRNWEALFDYTLSRKGFIKGEKFEAFFHERLNNITFKELKIPLFVTAFDLEKEREVIFTKGDVAKAIHASISIPGIFFPVQNKHRILIDAGVIDPIPTDILKKKGADIIIAVNVDYIKQKEPVINETAKVSKQTMNLPNMLDNASKSISFLGAEAAMYDLMTNKADLIINVHVTGAGLITLTHVKRSIASGEHAAMRSIEEIKKVASPNVFKQLIEEFNKNLPTENILPKIDDLKIGRKKK